jgi:hypothetical protein
MSWFILALVIPVLVAWHDGSTYAFGFSITGVGLALYFVTKFLTIKYTDKQAPGLFDIDIALGPPPPGKDYLWEKTAGTGIVPRWVSVLGLIGMGLIPAGLIVALLLWLGLITNKAA